MILKKTVIYIAIFAVLATGCSKGKGPDKEPDPYDIPHRLVEEYLNISFSLDNVFDVFMLRYNYLFYGYEDFAGMVVKYMLQELSNMQKEEFDNPENDPWHLEQHYFKYRSVLANGDSATLSGLVAYPMFNDSRQRPPFNGLTIFNDKVKVSDHTGEPELEIACRATLNQAVVSADIEGFGIQRERWVPYLDAFTKGRQSIDAAIAAKELLQAKGFEFKSDAKIFNYGISLGGHHALGTLKYYESDLCPESVRRALPDFITDVAICPIDIRKLFQEYLVRDKLGYPYVALMMISTIYAVFPEIQSEYSFEDFLSSTVNNAQVTVDGAVYTVSDGFKRKLIEPDKLTNTLNRTTGGYLRNILAQDMFDADGNFDSDNRKCRILLNALDSLNLSRDWHPRHELKMMYSPDDTIIYYGSIKEELNGFIDAGSKIDLNELFGPHEYVGLISVCDFLENRRYR